ncbi:hypothetical protein K0M31_002712 [Melipona bicolor]|uniref:Uncharacterized protein n=1 Tax=Melipona bicolor TaxID=60889 RepID=A0AA40FZH9_9HYME|nr:hypothetical protein K0M31_002712 [Melipona bicolor]
MSVTGKPKIWCPKEDYQTSKGDGISVSTTSGSSSWRSCREIETAMHQASGAKQEEGLFVSEPSRMAVADSVQSRYRFITNNLLFRDNVRAFEQTEV